MESKKKGRIVQKRFDDDDNNKIVAVNVPIPRYGVGSTFYAVTCLSRRIRGGRLISRIENTYVCNEKHQAFSFLIFIAPRLLSVS